jgi:hypothetical protein
MLEPGDVVRIGFMGSLFQNICWTSDFDTTSRITKSICVKRKINDVLVVPLKGNVCGEGMVLVTPQEAQANQDAYCDLLANYNVVRLANGASMHGPGWSGGNGCKISYEDTGDLFAALCRELLNSEPDENENMFIPETTFNLEQPLDFQGGWI